MSSLAGQIALVTGASRGIGREILHTLAKAGAEVIGTATSEQGAQKITEGLKAAKLTGQGKMLNVTDQASVDHLLGELKENAKMPSILVNNAGITRDNLLMRMSEEEWQSILNTNLSSVYRMSKACLRAMMKARFGRIITIGSVVGTMGNVGQVNYCAAKAGVIGFSKALAREIASRNITVNVVAPGFIQTDMTEKLPEAHKAALLAHIPLGVMGSPEDIANTVKFLASSDAKYITGETIHVNGGMLMD